MKKIFKIMIATLAFVFMMPVAFCSNLVASAATKPASSVVSLSTFSATVNDIISDYVQIKNREPGSVGEKQASEYIKNYLDTNTSLVAKNTTYVKDGIQTFRFESKFSRLYETSQNIIYTLKSSKETTKKVIIGCHYDSIAIDMNMESETYGKHIASESVNGSAGNVAITLGLAKYLNAENLDFDVEFVFFGAGESNQAGSKYYATGISSQDKSNILAMININQVAVGKNLYFYMNEIETKSDKFVSGVLRDNSVNVLKVSTANLNKVLLDEKSDLGLSYTHMALESDNASFMKEEIPTINIFAGDYSTGITIGRQEFAGKDLITYTTNDSLDYIAKNLTDYSVEDNLYEVFKAVYYVINDASFVKTFEAASNEMNWFYKIFASENLPFYLTVVAFIVFVIVAMYIYYKLSVRAYHANIEMEFLSSVMKITDQIDKTGKDDKVAKVVSQVIANDIKKDKTIKVKKEKKDGDKN